MFYEAARAAGHELTRVYEKLFPGVWVYNGRFRIAGAWLEPSGLRQVFKFRFESVDEDEAEPQGPQQVVERTRVIPSLVKQEVWRRDGGKCVLCGAIENLHFDHELPFSRGGSSTVANVRVLCATHNLKKSDRIE